MSNFNQSIFRAYDVRGIALGQAREVTPELAYALGVAFGLRVGPGQKVLLGQDNRATGQALLAALTDGLITAGCQVSSLGYATSPYLYFGVCAGGFAAGVNVTASHNPAQYNGFKLVWSGAKPLTSQEIQELAAAVQTVSIPATLPATSAATPLDLRQDYFDRINQLAPLQQKKKVVLDCGNGTAGYFAGELFRQIGCEVVELFCDPDPTFPHHLPNPEDASSLVALQQKVLETGADLGLAFDGDGDRVGAVDETGAVIVADRLLILLARDLLTRQPGAQVIFDVKCSTILENEIRRLGGRPIRWRTGHSFIKSKMRETGALLAGEVSGHIFFGEDYYGVDDGLLAGAKLVSILARSDQPLSQHFIGLPESHTTPELKLPIADSVKFQVMGNLVNDFTELSPDELDGVRVSWPDGAWGLVRASNTSPYLTARFEADSFARLAEVKKIFADKLAAYPELDCSALHA